MRTAYPIGTDVTVFDFIKGKVMAVSFYPNYCRYLIMHILDGKLEEEWYDEQIITVNSEEKKIGFNI